MIMIIPRSKVITLLSHTVNLQEPEHYFRYHLPSLLRYSLFTNMFRYVIYMCSTNYLPEKDIPVQFQSYKRCLHVHQVVGLEKANLAVERGASSTPSVAPSTSLGDPRATVATLVSGPSMYRRATSSTSLSLISTWRTRVRLDRTTKVSLRVTCHHGYQNVCESAGILQRTCKLTRFTYLFNVRIPTDT